MFMRHGFFIYIPIRHLICLIKSVRLSDSYRDVETGTIWKRASFICEPAFDNTSAGSVQADSIILMSYQYNVKVRKYMFP